MKRITLSICLLLLLNCHKYEEHPPVRITQIHMDTYTTISVYDNNFDEQFIVRKVEEAFDVIGHIEKIANAFSDTSEIYFINSQAGVKPVTITEEMGEIIKGSLKYCKMTDGAFDITVFPIVRLWNFMAENPKVPKKENIQERLPLVNYENIIFNDDKISFRINGMGIDPGGFLKGYAIDRVVSLLKRDGFKKFVIDMGGDLGIYIIDDDTASVKIQHPRGGNGFWGEFEIKEGSIATSGDYERYFEIGGVRYHHIINPTTGYPQSDCVSVTIVTEKAELADAFATGVFVMELEKGFDFINKSKDIEGVIIYKEDNILKSLVSEGMIDKYNYIEYE